MNWSALETTFDSLTRDRQALLLRSLLTSYKFDPSTITKWENAFPRGNFLQCFRFVYFDYQASEARGAALAVKTSDKQHDGHRLYSEKAYAAIREILDVQPNHLHALTWLIQANFADIIEWDTLIDFYHQAKQEDPHFFPIAERMLYYLSPKWYGSEEEILEFVAFETKDKPPGSPFWGLVPAAYFHIWEYDKLLDYNPDRNVLLEAREQIEHAYQMSLGSPSYKSFSYDFFLYNFFAFAYHDYQDEKRTAELLQKMGAVYTFHPWYAYLPMERSHKLKPKIDAFRASYGLPPLAKEDFA